MSFESRGVADNRVSYHGPVHGNGPDPHSPLVWRDFVSDQSLLQFLEERVQQEPSFKQLLLSYM
jgi:hypothetical protein